MPSDNLDQRIQEAQMRHNAQYPGPLDSVRRWMGADLADVLNIHWQGAKAPRLIFTHKGRTYRAVGFTRLDRMGDWWATEGGPDAWLVVGRIWGPFTVSKERLRTPDELLVWLGER